MPVGAMYVQKPPSPLSQLLGGVGKGVSYAAMGNLYATLREKEKERTEKDKKVNDLLDLAATGKDLRRLATPRGKELLKAQGIDDNPGVQNLLRMSETEWGETAPDLRTMQELRKIQKEERIRQLEEERNFRINEKVLTQQKLRIEKEAHDISVDPTEKLERLEEYRKAGEEFGLTAETLPLTISGIGTIPFITEEKREQDLIKRGEKADTEFFRLHKEVGADRTRITQAVARIGAGQKPSTLGALLDYLAESRGISAGKMDGLKPDDQIRMVVKAHNDEYKIKHDRLRKLAPGARQRVPKFKPLNAEAFIKGEVEKIYEPRESFKPEEARDKIMPPIETPREESIQDAIGDIHLKFENVRESLAVQGKTYTKEDLIDDLESEREGIIAQYGLTLHEFEAIIKRIREGK